MSGLVLAVDGGNAKTDLALVATDGRVHALVRGPGSSPHEHGVEGALDRIEALVIEAGAEGPVDHAELLLAGVDFPSEVSTFRARAQERGWATSVEVANDTFAVLRAGTTRGWGVAVVCGSGLNCAGVGPDGRVVRFPSLGELSGDLAHGGGWLGRAALGAALRGRDGRGRRTLLETLVPEHFRMARPASVMEALYVGRLDGQRMLEIAPVVFRAARRGDEVSRELIAMVGDEVVATANAAIRRLRITTRTFEVILGGGIFRSGDGRLLTRVRDGINAVAPRAVMRRLAAPPVLGAALIGLDATRAGAAARERLSSKLTDRRLS